MGDINKNEDEAGERQVAVMDAPGGSTDLTLTATNTVVNTPGRSTDVTPTATNAVVVVDTPGRSTDVTPTATNESDPLRGLSKTRRKLIERVVRIANERNMSMEQFEKWILSARHRRGRRHGTRGRGRRGRYYRNDRRYYGDNRGVNAPTTLAVYGPGGPPRAIFNFYGSNFNMYFR